MALLLPPGLTPPRQATARNWDRPTYGAHSAAAFAALGRKQLPWQRYVADVAGEADDNGVLVYPTVVLTVQRQAGKTTMDLADDLRNGLSGPNRKIWYTAQTGQHARDKFLEMNEEFTNSPLSRLGHSRIANGSESLTLANGSVIRPHPPTADSLHSKQSDKNTIDEAWHFSQAEGAALLQAIVPTKTTRLKVTGQRPQTWIVSTEGNVMSGFFNEILTRARAGDPSIAFFDWGIAPDIDPTDLDAVYAAHPGAGHLFERDDLDGYLTELGPSGFARAFGNRRTGSADRVIPLEQWRAAATDTPMPHEGKLCFAAAVGMESADTSILAAMRQTVVTESGVESFVMVEVIEHRPGDAWAIARIKELAERHKAPFVIDKFGPSAGLHDEAERAGITLIPIDSRGVTAACQSVYTGIVRATPPSWRYRPHTALDDAAELANRRTIGDGAWAWGRRASVGSISAIEAATNASWGLDHLPQEIGLQLW